LQTVTPDSRAEGAWGIPGTSWISLALHVSGGYIGLSPLREADVTSGRPCLQQAGVEPDFMPSQLNQKRLALEAARLMVERIETEYLHAKERAILLLGLPYNTPYPTNRQIKEYIAKLTRRQLGPEVMTARVREMREIAEEIMTVLQDFDPHLIGSTLSGQIRDSSDIDLHVYCDHHLEVERLMSFGYTGVEPEYVENQKGTFVHLRWLEKGYPVEITVHNWSQRSEIPISSVTGKPMKRADLDALRVLLRRCSIERPWRRE
jgi:predicted nucleotidyltransferase